MQSECPTVSHTHPNLYIDFFLWRWIKICEFLFINPELGVNGKRGVIKISWYSLGFPSHQFLFPSRCKSSLCTSCSPVYFPTIHFFLLPGYSILVDMRAVYIQARIEKKYEAQVFLTRITESRAKASFQLSLGAVTICFPDGQILIKIESTCHCSLDVSSSWRLARLHFWSCSP